MNKLIIVNNNLLTIDKLNYKINNKYKILLTRYIKIIYLYKDDKMYLL